MFLIDMKHLALAITNGETEYIGYFIGKLEGYDMKHLALAITNGETEYTGYFIGKLEG